MAAPQRVDDGGQRGNRLAAIATAVVHEHDRAGPRRGHCAAHDHGRPGAGPVAGVHRPERHQHLQPLGHGQRSGVVSAIRRPEQPRERRPEAGQSHRGIVELLVLAGGREPREVGVVLGVVADREPLAQLVPEPRGEIVQLLTDDEERGRRVHSREDPHDLVGVGAGTVVKGQRDHTVSRNPALDERRVRQHPVDPPGVDGGRRRLRSGG